MSAEFIALLILAYIAGALPWSAWLLRLLFRVDVRTVADGNPGTTNAFRVGGWHLGAGVLLLDFFKAFIPVMIARWGIGLPEFQLLLIALMPTIGHPFSIFLGFRGGRALVTLFGVWSGLTLYEVPLVMGGTAIAALFVFKNDAHRSLTIPAAVIVYLLVRSEPGWMIALAVTQLLIVAVRIGLPNLMPGLRS
jgi:acyl phosphate:glycerol-3-phosphate acyltransferase